MARPIETPEGPPRRLYFALRAGGAMVTNPHVSPELEVRPEPPAIGPLNQYFGAALGLDRREAGALRARGPRRGQRRDQRP